MLVQPGSFYNVIQNLFKQLMHKAKYSGKSQTQISKRSICSEFGPRGGVEDGALALENAPAVLEEQR